MSSLSSRPWISSRLAAPTSACASRFPLHSCILIGFPPSRTSRSYARTDDGHMSQSNGQSTTYLPPHPLISHRNFLSRRHAFPTRISVPCRCNTRSRSPTPRIPRACTSQRLPSTPKYPRPSSGGRCLISRSAFMFLVFAHCIAFAFALPPIPFVAHRLSHTIHTLHNTPPRREEKKG